VLLFNNLIFAYTVTHFSDNPIKLLNPFVTSITSFIKPLNNELFILFPFIAMPISFLDSIYFWQSRRRPTTRCYRCTDSQYLYRLHAHSNDNGTFRLQQVNNGDTLRLYHLNYQSVDVVVDEAILAQEVVTVRLQEQLLDLETVVILPEAHSLNILTNIDTRLHPVNSAQQILQKVPGLFIGQHAGGGKAEQIFLRGFDIDHGTDITLQVDGMPVNMVSHAHGQGYADLHFVIPETVEKIDFGKGPYATDKGNFNTAGYVDFKTKTNLENSLVKLEVGQFNTFRTLGLFEVLDKEKHQAYAGLEYHSTDGSFESPQNFNRLNLFGKYTGTINNNDKIGITLSHFTSKWDASGQIPQRAVDQGLLTRFGAIDDTEGGETSRSNVLLTYNKVLSNNSYIQNNFYYTNYAFQLFSNFTFFLEDSINGDQIMQQENRHLVGLNSTYHKNWQWKRSSIELAAGISLRHDQSLNNELSRTRNRQETLERIQFGDIYETNAGAFVKTSLETGKWAFGLGVRFDYFDFQYYDRLAPSYETQSANETFLSPDLSITFTPNRKVQLYLKGGRGFHSNDTRVVVARNGRQILPAAYGADLGIQWKPLPRLLVNTAAWYLFLEQEFVYVGDAGIVEPSGKTQRQGVELSVRHQLLDWLFWNLDANYTYARAIDENPGENFIPLAPDLTIVGGLQVVHPSGIYGSAQVRYLKNRPANEDNSIVAEGYAVVDLNAGFRFKRFDIGFQINNLLNTEWNETQFATESRLRNEAEPVEEIHFTPGTPFFFRGIVQYSF
jgi:outer membrane cobalamin receptor